MQDLARCIPLRAKGLLRARGAAEISCGCIDFGRGLGYASETFAVQPRNDLLGEIIMQWTAPAFEEICLNCEINSYASAKL
jgi:coenzyme PQQ precursor peptide PqqA